MYRFNAIQIKIPSTFLAEVEKPILKVTWNQMRPKITKTIFNKSKSRGITIPDIKLYYKVPVITA